MENLNNMIEIERCQRVSYFNLYFFANLHSQLNNQKNAYYIQTKRTMTAKMREREKERWVCLTGIRVGDFVVVVVIVTNLNNN